MNTLDTIQSVQNAGSTQPPTDAVLSAARAACTRIAPLWPLKNFVAVNPFLGVTELPFSDACSLYSKLIPAGMQMQPSYYQAKLASGEISAADLDAALKSAAEKISAPASNRVPDPETLKQAVAALKDQTQNASPTKHGQAVVEWISHFCASYFDAGQSTWRSPWRTCCDPSSPRRPS